MKLLLSAMSLSWAPDTLNFVLWNILSVLSLEVVLPDTQPPSMLQEQPCHQSFMKEWSREAN